MKPISDGYRADIDGLRAIAVLFVTIFHINEALIPGGFIGVDIFFVISGYLITGIIVRERAAGRFSFAEFYRRRIRRIFPAMFLVTGVTLAVGVAVMLPRDVEALSWSALATVLSVANVHFTYALDTSYFAASNASLPLLHMWSLGVEEQFYLFWPAMLIVLLKWPRTLVPILLVLAISSIGLGELMLRNENAEWAYYMLPARAFQLAMGGLLVFALPLLAAMRPAVAALLAAAGAILCGASAFLLSSELPYPGLTALPVTVGAAALLAGGVVPNSVSRLLAFAPLRGIGLISYSIYLWHWPVLAFQRYLFGELPALQQVLSLVTTLALAWLSYRFVEQPARRSTLTLRRTALRMAVVPLTLIGSAVGVLVLTSGMGPWTLTDYPERLRPMLTNARPATAASYVCQKGILRVADVEDRACVVNAGGPSEPTVLLWGDSNAGHYVGALRALALEAGFSFRNAAHDACPSILEGAHKFANSRRASACRHSAEVALGILGRYRAIILASAWDTYIGRHGDAFVEALANTISILRADGKVVMILGRVPRLTGFDASCARKRLKVPLISCTPAVVDAERIERTNSVLRDVAARAGALYVDFNDLLCPAGVCSERLDETSLYFDPGHLSRVGSEKLGEAARSNKDIVAKFKVFSAL